MKRTFGHISAVLFTVAALSAFSAPAMAGSSFGFSVGGHHGFHDNHHGVVTFGFDERPSYRHSWRRHVRWCFDHHASYDPDSNRYFNGHRWRQCHSPFI